MGRQRAMILAIGFTGTRKGLTPKQRATLREELAETLISAHKLSSKIMPLLVHGGCVGADDEADDLANELGIRRNIYPATAQFSDPDCHFRIMDRKNSSWKFMPPDLPLARNQHIVDNSGVLIACPNTRFEQIRSGTWSTVRYAKRIERSVIIIFPDGSKVKE